ncbi:hypothetical protein GUITHDRAFT_110782 [Guillardia theta CCMP2712]|uniref:Uncharacterized protein n=1 Tax=Guillardia theta (strain CCMP2712) TaxID=905079 RepID=L1J4X6_GUITC|nr:hypothetical protein GUITHDRAFT_110782 [Guillardia theta CCMP2712]EKX43362.1 hypothetical protein GUITHDRAFT_110782 [Guillardia theta CCMP2712]|eukprot:XP_005830342.1 hypothetical protein GUITHDRAFT_110782 [Guillardia theta CCMP2712]
MVALGYMSSNRPSAQRPVIAKDSSQAASTGPNSTHSYHNLQTFQNEAVATTINAVLKDGLLTPMRSLKPSECQTLIKCVLSKEEPEAALIGTAMVKIPKGLPKGGDWCAYGSSASIVLSPCNTLFEDLQQLREAMLTHVRALHAKDSKAERPEDHSPVDERISSTLLPCSVFHGLSKVSDKVGGYQITSRFGSVLLSARDMVRCNAAPPSSSGRRRHGPSRPSRRAWRSPASPRGQGRYLRAGPALHALPGGIVAGPGGQRGEDGGERRPRGVEQWDPRLAAERFIDDKHGTNRCDLVCGQAHALHSHARKITKIHVSNQVMREILRMRPEPLSDEARRLTAQHKGRYIKSESLMQTLNGELRKEMTKEELAEADAFVAKAYKRREPTVECVRGQVTKTYNPAGAEIATVSADFEMGYNTSLSCATPPFKGKSITLELGNCWKLESHVMTLIPKH